MQPQVIADYHCDIGEGPLWHPIEKRVYWVDIPQGRIFRLNPFSRRHEQVYDSRIVGGFTIQTDGSLLLFLDKGTIAIWRDEAMDVVIDQIDMEVNNRFNDVIADPMGRVFCGTMPTDNKHATLYRVDTDGSLKIMLEGVGLSNGMGFTPDLKQMYFTDSFARTIYIFDYAIDSGNLTNRRVFVETPNDGSIPDGMTVDAEGYVWSARWDGSSLYRYNPEGQQVNQIRFPAKKISSVIFGGTDLTDMYVTTAGGSNKLEEGPGAGGLFHMNLGIKGKPEFLSQVGMK